MEEKGLSVDDARIDAIKGEGKTLIFVLIDGKVDGAIALADVIRPESREAVSRLKAMDIRCLMITGDSAVVAGHVAHEVGIDEYFAGVLPEKKAEKVKEVQARGITVAMVGDGVNDAPALAAADVGIAIGAGTDVAIAAAGIVLVRSDPRDVVKVIRLARTTYNKMVQNLIWATGYNVIAIPLAAGVLYSQGILLSPAAGAVLMSLSTVIVAINARLLRIRD
jgi:Cu2+-exporting ATPase